MHVLEIAGHMARIPIDFGACVYEQHTRFITCGSTPPNYIGSPLPRDSLIDYAHAHNHRRPARRTFRRLRRPRFGITADATPAEIKRAYRKLISQNHPDKLATRGLPESMRPVAEERSRELNSAHDMIKNARPDVW
jgi:DnaJ domain